MAVDLIDLPPEILVKILSNVDGASLARNKRVNRKLRGFIENTLLLKHLVELAANGLVDGNGNIPVAERYRRLLSYRDAWLNLRWKEMKKYPRSLLNGMRELIRGYLIESPRIGPDAAPAPAYFILHKMPGVNHGTSPTSWKHYCTDGGYDATHFLADFAMDPSQDLLLVIWIPRELLDGVALVDCIFQSRSLSSGSMHPKSCQPTVLMQIPASRLEDPLEVCHTAKQIFGEYCAIAVLRGLFRVWNWRTGVIKMAIDTEEYRIWSFSILTDRSIIFATQQVEGGCEAVRLDLCDLESPSQEQVTSVKPTHSLLLPVLRDGFRVGFLQLVHDVLPHGRHLDSKSQSCPFQWNQEDRMFVLTISVGSQPLCATFTISHGLLSTLIKNYGVAGDAKIATPSSGPILIPWEDWGPQTSRVLLIPDLDDVYVSAGRLLRRDPCRPDGEKYLQILDFNQRRVLRSVKLMEELDSTGANWTTVMVPSTIHKAKWCFRDDIVTSLPYILTDLETPFDFEAAMIDENNIVLIREPQGWIVALTF